MRKLNDVMLAPDGYNSDGTAKEWRAVQVLSEVDGVCKIRFIDTGETVYSYKRHLRDFPEIEAGYPELYIDAEETERRLNRLYSIPYFKLDTVYKFYMQCLMERKQILSDMINMKGETK